MTKLAITTREGDVDRFIRYTVGLGHPPSIETVPFEDATLFDDPDTVERVIRYFQFEHTSKIEIINVSWVRSVGDSVDKYNTFLRMASERMIPSVDKSEVLTHAKRKKEDTNYPLYLFAMLWHHEYTEYDDLEYDLAHNKIKNDWNSFEGSKYDDNNVSLYDCILEFFKSKRVGES